MTKITNSDFSCPFCKKEFKFSRYETVNVTLDPKLREKLFNNELFKVTCPHCGTEMHVLYDVLYHDMDKKFMIQYSPERSDAINNKINKLYAKSPNSRLTPISRTVADLTSFKEKILLYENDLNDIAIEFLKVDIRYSKNHNIPSDAQILFYSQVNKGAHLLIFRWLINDELQKEMAIVPYDYYLHCLEIISKEPRFSLNDTCATIDRNWIESRLCQE